MICSQKRQTCTQKKTHNISILWHMIYYILCIFNIFFFSLQRPSPELPLISGVSFTSVRLEDASETTAWRGSSPRQIQFRHCQPFNFQPYKPYKSGVLLGYAEPLETAPKPSVFEKHRETQIAGRRTTSQDSVTPSSDLRSGGILPQNESRRGGIVSPVALLATSQQ